MGRSNLIKDTFAVDDFNVTILYECTCDDIDYIIQTLKEIDCPYDYILKALDNLESCNLNSGLTYSNLKMKSAVIIISKTSSQELFINTVAHEYYHLICHISKALGIEDEEQLATLSGDLNMRSYKILEQL